MSVPDLNEYTAGMIDAQFLLSQEVHAYLFEIRKRASAMQALNATLEPMPPGAEKAKLAEKASEEFRWLSEQLDVLPGKFKPFLTLALSRRPRSCGSSGCPVANRMKRISYSGYRFPRTIIQQAIWLYLRFTLSLRDVEDLLAERGITVSYESIRRWINHFGPMIAADLRKRRPKPHTSWHLDEVYLKIDGRMVYLWRAVDAEGEILDVLVQSKRDKHAAVKLIRKLLKKYGFVPDRLITDDLRSYGAAARDPRHREAPRTRSMAQQPS
jgi:transposase-like protein